MGKKVLVTFLDTLRDSTTYTLDFGNAICDYTEKIPLRGYRYCFSTGDHIDSMEVRGRLVNSEDLNPISGIIVGIHSDMSDTAFTTKCFDNIAKTDSAGRFVISNIKEGQYRIYALSDISRDYMYEPGEGLAFTNDSVGSEEVLLWFFKENKVRRYFQRAYREEPYLMRFVFSGKQDVRPSFRAVRPSEVDSTYGDSAYIDWLPYTWWKFNETNDTVWAWFTDSVAIRQDSVFCEVTYERTDSLYNIEKAVDTVKCIYRAPRLTEKMAEQMINKARNRKVEIKCSAKGKHNIGQPVVITMSMPIDSMYRDSITLWQKQDTTYHPLTMDWVPLDSAGIQYEVVYPWKSGGAYELRIDSAAVRDIYGKVNNKTIVQFSIRSVEEYATLNVTMAKYDPRMVVQLLDEKGTPLAYEAQCTVHDDAQTGKKASLLFTNLEPKAYYMRMFIDENGDGEWTTGDWSEKRQPESVYYYDKKMQFKANWDFEEEWDYTALPQLDAKPKELIKDAAK